MLVSQTSLIEKQFSCDVLSGRDTYETSITMLEQN